MTTRVTEGARRERHDERVSLFSSRAAALVSRVSRLLRSTLAGACIYLTKSAEKESLLAVYFAPFSASIIIVFVCQLIPFSA